MILKNRLTVSAALVHLSVGDVNVM